MEMSEKMRQQLERFKNPEKFPFAAFEYDGTSETGKVFYFMATSVNDAVRQCLNTVRIKNKAAYITTPTSHAVRCGNLSYIVTRDTRCNRVQNEET